MMKIAHVVDSMEVGGAETLVLQMCRLQREQGHSPCVYAIAALGTLGEQMKAEGFSVTPNVGCHLADSTVTFYRIFRKLQPDVVHLHNPTPTIYAGPAARVAGVSSVISTRHSLVAPPHNRIMENKYSIAARFCDWVVGICDATTQNIKQLRRVAPQKIVRVYNGALPLARIENRQSPDEGPFTLLYVGRLEPVKNLELLLNAFRSALSCEPRLRLWIVGDGSQRNRLEQLSRTLRITDQVTFWGQQLDVAGFYSAADAFAMSSHSEGLPMSLLQAFSLGLPAVVSDVGGMAEVVRLAQAGFTVSAIDSAEMATAILRLANNPNERTQLSINAEKTFHEQFTLSLMADRYMELYRNTARALRAAGLRGSFIA